MDYHSRTSSYDDVNKEIQELISRRNNQSYHSSEPKQDILPLLESINRTYNEINTYLKTENPEALKDVILKSDIKMSLVCETLLDTLKTTVEEKNKYIRENTELERTISILKEKECKNKIQIEKLDSELECRNGNILELNRVIRDQKDRITEYKEDSVKSKSDASLYKLRLSELENLRNKANEKLEVYEKEMEALNEFIKDREATIRALIAEKKEEENKNISIKTKIAEAERMIEILNSKNEAREKNLNLCNNELSKVLMENKTMKNDFEKYKESSIYYENLYNNLNKQNAYLNNQLNKFLVNGSNPTEHELKHKKYKKKYKKVLKKIDSLREENIQIKRQVSEHKNGSDADPDTTDALIKRIDELTEKNKDYKSKIASLESDKKDIERQIAKIEKKPEYQYGLHKNQMNAFNKDINGIEKMKPESKINMLTVKNKEEPFNKFTTEKPVYDAYKYNYLNGPMFSSNNRKLSDAFSTPNFVKPLSDELIGNRYNGYAHDEMHIRDKIPFNLDHRPYNSNREIEGLWDKKAVDNPGAFDRNNYNTKDSNNEYMKLFNLDNQYEKKEEFIGGFANNTEDTIIKPVSLQYTYENDPLKGDIIKETVDNNFPTNLYNKEPFNNKDSKYADIYSTKAPEPGYEASKIKTENPLLRGYYGPITANNNTKYQDASKFTQPNILKTTDESRGKAEENLSKSQNPFKHVQKAEIDNPFADEASEESIKTYHTTSTLKDMMARTDNLQKKFENLEQQLANINEGDSEDRLASKIKTYNNYISDWNIEANNDDIL